jgi:hypothetical protein
MAATSAYVTRTADFTLVGPRGGTIAVTAPNGGQKVTRTATGFTYSVGGMKRVATGAGGATLFDVETKTLSDITITGATRATRNVNGGELEVKHLRRGYTIVLAPENLQWSGTCNCPVSGKLTGTVTDGGTGTVTLEMTGCGTATLTTPNDSENITFERCGSI